MTTSHHSVKTAVMPCTTTLITPQLPAHTLLQCPVTQQCQPVLTTPPWPARDTYLLERQFYSERKGGGDPLHVLTFLC